MIYLLFLIWIAINSSFADQQYYDHSGCPSDTSYPGSRYSCSSVQQPCKTFLVYRANQHFQNLLNISALFQKDSTELLDLNNIASASEILKPGREVLVPINCLCSENYFQASLSYIVNERTLLSEIACGVFEGLLKSLTLLQENPSQKNDVEIGVKLHLPLRCACPDNFTSFADGVKYLVTYPLLEGDGTTPISEKFGISPEDLLAANHLDPKSTIFPNTTVLIPLKSEPHINLHIPDSPPPTPDFLPTTTVEKTKNTKLRQLYIAGSIVGFFLVAVALLACGLYVKALKKWKGEKLRSFSDRNSIRSGSTPRSSPQSGQAGRSSPRSGQTGRTSTNSCLSSDLLAGIKFSLYNYGVEDIKGATNDFNEDNKIGEQVYKGLIDNADVMIKQMKFEDTRQVIDMHSRINHINIVNLHGVCYGENDYSWSYLIFELPSNGCLRDCLSNQSNRLRWERRTQIAFDVATGLHYLHYCIFPSYAHMSVNSRNIFVTSKWRAELANIGSTLAVSSSRGNGDGWVAPEYPMHGSTSEKVDIFAFGVVLLELISGKEATEGNLLKESIGFLGGEASEGGCFEQLRSFIDPSLKEDYLLAEALCLAVLAKSCIEEDRLRRPSMDDILKVIGRMV